MAYVDASKFVKVPLEFMNADHGEELHLLESLGEALELVRGGRGPADAVLERLALLAVHTREHFLREESAMRLARFPVYAAHKAEHDRVLAEMDAEVHRFRESGDGERLWSYLFEDVPAWFASHIGAMDLATARFIAEHGGDLAAAGDAGLQ